MWQLYIYNLKIILANGGMPMNLTNHIKERYVERIKDIADKNEIKQYIAQHDVEISNDILKLKEYSQLIYTGNIGDTSNGICHFYLRNNVILLTNVTDDCLITLYKVDLPYPEKTNKIVIHDIVEEMEQLRTEQATLKAAIEIKEDKRQHEIGMLNDDIALLKKQIGILEGRRDLIIAEGEEEQGKVKEIDIKLKRNANMLCNSLEFKKEMLQAKMLK